MADGIALMETIVGVGGLLLMGLLMAWERRRNRVKSNPLN